MENSSGHKKSPAASVKPPEVVRRRYPELAPSFEHEALAHVEMPIWREIRILLAAKLYGADRMSSERAAKLAGLPHVEFLLNLGFYKVFPLQAELNDLERSHD